MTNERRAEIVRILVCRRQETMGRLARELDVTDRTIRNDITVLSVDYPLETVRGNGGCVRLADWYYPHKTVLTQEQQWYLIGQLDVPSEIGQRLCREMLTGLGFPDVRKKYGNLRKSL
jgi:predicted DNA-binding transcriptional regulator YafY